MICKQQLNVVMTSYKHNMMLYKYIWLQIQIIASDKSFMLKQMAECICLFFGICPFSSLCYGEISLSLSLPIV